MPAGPRLAATEAMLRVCFFPLPQDGRRDEWAGADRTNDGGHQCRRRPRFQKLTTHRRRLWCTTLFVLLLVLVLSLAVLVLVLEAIQYSNPAYWSASSREPLRSTSGNAAVQTAIEYEYRFTEYRPPRRTEYEYDEIQCEGTNACFVAASYASAGTSPNGVELRCLSHFFMAPS
jgi:hypothetical protein